MKAILMKPPEPLPEEVPESLRSVVGRALEREASKRYPDATAMREALAGAGASAPGGGAPRTGNGGFARNDCRICNG